MSILSLASLGSGFRNIFRIFNRQFTVLGIETSCDDTGVGIVTADKHIVGEKLLSQQSIHIRYGGIIPPFAQDHHRENIQEAVSSCLTESNTSMKEIDAVAVTTSPGLPMSLIMGLRFAKYLCRKFEKPLIPIHHMQAHALTARLAENIPFPFICLLLSGGHCQLVFVKDACVFYLLGETLDDAPGEAFDKISRMLKLHYVPTYEKLSGGEAIEAASKECSAFDKYDFAIPLQRYNDCQFSFAGLKNNASRLIKKIELENDIRPDEMIHTYREFCGSFLRASAKHICQRTQRCIEYCLKEGLFNESCTKSLVVAGGVAANDFLFNACKEIATHYEFEIHRPCKRYCRDNGIMIAWNGIEKIQSGTNCFEDIDRVKVKNKNPIGISLIDNVQKTNIHCKWIGPARNK